MVGLRAGIFRAKWLALGIAGAFFLLTLPLELWAQQGAQVVPGPGSGALVGFIYGADMKTPVSRAVVRIRNLQDGREYASEPTDENGLYKLQGIKEGRYILGISTPAGDYNFEYEIFIKAGEVGKLSLALKPGNASTLGQEEEEKEKKKPFFLTPVGIAIVIVASGLAIYGTYKLLEELGVISPVKK
jgi:hypothetical protein